MVGHLLGASGAVEAIATIQVSVALLEARHNFVSLYVAMSLSFVKLPCGIFNLGVQCLSSRISFEVLNFTWLVCSELVGNFL